MCLFFSEESICVRIYLHLLTHRLTYTYNYTYAHRQMDRWADRHIRKKQRTKDGRWKTEDGKRKKPMYTYYIFRVALYIQYRWGLGPEIHGCPNPATTYLGT